MRYYSCDSHVVEAREVFDGLERRFGDAGAADRARLQGPARRLARPARARRRSRSAASASPATASTTRRPTSCIARGYDGLNPGVRDPARAPRRAGASTASCGEVMYPSLNMFTLRRSPTATWRAPCSSATTTGSSTTARSRRSGSIGIGCLPIPDVDAALAEMERAAERGVRGFTIPAHVDARPALLPPRLRPASGRRRRTIGVPLTMHIFTGTVARRRPAGALGHAGRRRSRATRWPTPPRSTRMIDLICGGVCERFPRPALVISEFETGWVAHFLQRLDHATYRTPKYAVDYLTMKPCDYFHRNFSSRSRTTRPASLTRHLIGVRQPAAGATTTPTTTPSGRTR